jgi:hypothetical protein
MLFIQHFRRRSQLDWQSTNPSHRVVLDAEAMLFHLNILNKLHDCDGRGDIGVWTRLVATTLLWLLVQSRLRRMEAVVRVAGILAHGPRPLAAAVSH